MRENVRLHFFILLSVEDSLNRTAEDKIRRTRLHHFTLYRILHYRQLRFYSNKPPTRFFKISPVQYDLFVCFECYQE